MSEGVTPPILTLPPEVRGQIFNFLSPFDATAVRLVCAQFRHDVDSYVEFVAEIDDSSQEKGNKLSRILELRLRELRIKSFRGPPPSTKCLGTQILKFPSLLKVLTLLPGSVVNVANLHYLIQDCSQSLEILEMDLGVEVANAGTGFQPLVYKLQKLLSLTLKVSTVPSPEEVPLLRGPPTALALDTIISYLLPSSIAMLKLRELKLQIRCLGYRQVSQLSALTLEAIVNCRSSLKNVEFDLIQGHGVPSAEERPLAESDLEKLDLSLLSRVNSIQSLRIINSTAIGIDLWAKLLSNQKKLVYLETDILPAPASLFRQIILNNETSLQEVDIGDLTIDVDEETGQILPFDLAVFADCENLRKCTLDRNSTRPRNNLLPLTPDLINLTSLSHHNLVELNLNYFLIPSYSLLSLFSSPLPSLQSLSLTQCGESGEFGVNGSVLHQIILLPSISFVEISPLNFSDEQETLKLNMILETFGYPAGHSYFQLVRREPLESGERASMSDLL